MFTTVQDLKKAIQEYVYYVVKSNTTANSNYEKISDNIYNEKIKPFVVNENITTWESDIKKRFMDNPYAKFEISEKQAFCLARAYQAINTETIK